MKEQIPYKDVPLDASFYTDDGEVYRKTKQGAKSCDNYGEIDHIPDNELVTLA